MQTLGPEVLDEPIAAGQGTGDASDGVDGGVESRPPSASPPPPPGDRPRPTRARSQRSDSAPTQLIGIIVLTSFAVITAWSVGWNLLLENTTATGGDMGAHVATPWFARNYLLPSLHLTGWSDGAYAGFPILHFYFPGPTWVIVALSFIMPMNIAFKLVTVSGLIAMPFAGYGLGRLARLPRPLPVMIGLATVPFLYERSYNIYGGNILSTMAGEFSFSISITLCVLFVGLVVRALATGEHRPTAAAVLGFLGICHLLPTIWIGVVALLCLLFHLDPRRTPLTRAWVLTGVWCVAAVVLFVALPPIAAEVVLLAMLGTALIADERSGGRLLGQFATLGWIGALGGALVMWWIAPFYKKLDYTNDMGWEKLTQYRQNLFGFLVDKPPSGASVFAIAFGLALVAAAWSIGTLLLALWRAMRTQRGGWHGPAAAFCGALGLLVGFGLLDSGVWREPGVNLGYRLLAAVAVAVFLIAVIVGPHLGSWQRLPLVFTYSAFLCALTFRFSPQFRLWNARVLPFWMLSVYLLAGWGFYALCLALRNAIHWVSRGQRSTRSGAALATVGAGLFTYAMIAVPLGIIPRGVPFPKYRDGLVGLQQAGDSGDYATSAARSWPRHNYGGYESKSSWKDFKSILDTMDRVGREQGCGRAFWEYEEQQDRWGTPMALMTLPKWTDGCIGSSEGLYFESSATTPYHFMNAALLSKAPSNPQRNLPYEGLNVEKGVQRLQQFGIRYYMAFSKAATDQANALPDLLTPVANAPYTRTCSQDENNGGACPTTWTIYLVKGSENVAPLPFEPAVVTGIGQAQQEGWLDFGTVVFRDTLSYPVPYAAGGPAEWQRVPVNVADRPEGTGTYGEGVTIGATQQRPLPKVSITDIEKRRDGVSFKVDRVGVPVAVRTSYFPNFTVKGGKGPWRLAPNTMVVVPTSTQVDVVWRTTPIDRFGQVVSLAGAAGCIVLWRRDRRRRLVPAPAPVGPDVPAAPAVAPELDEAGPDRPELPELDEAGPDRPELPELDEAGPDRPEVAELPELAIDRRPGDPSDALPEEQGADGAPDDGTLPPGPAR
jgi:hypothetical protein